MKQAKNKKGNRTQKRGVTLGTKEKRGVKKLQRREINLKRSRERAI